MFKIAVSLFSSVFSLTSSPLPVLAQSGATNGASPSALPPAGNVGPTVILIAVGSALIFLGIVKILRNLVRS